MEQEKESFEGWAILELMGHRRLGGRVREQTVAGAPFVRIDVPAVGAILEFTQFYAPGSVYCLTPTTEELARAIAAQAIHQPVRAYELPKLPPAPRDHESGAYGGETDDDHEDDEDPPAF
jgi:hypothetical protein